MGKKTIQIPLGSQHISLLEPIRFKFECENEKIIDVDSDVGFVHRGIEQACVTKFKYDTIPYVVARICGLCAITHSLCYTTAVESLLEGEITHKTKYLRMLLVDLDRIHSHMLCLAHTAENAGFEALFMRIMGDREDIMNLQEKITGNRIQFDYICIGGVNRDLNRDLEKDIKKILHTIRSKVQGYLEEFQNNFSLSLKYKNIGVLTENEAYRYNAIGPLARAANIPTDARLETSYLPYEAIGFTIQTTKNGDIYSRNMVRLYEMLNSIMMCENILDGMPEGNIYTKLKGKPNGEALVRLEAPRGELIYYLKGDNKLLLNRVRIKTPTFASIPAFMKVFRGSQYADAPAILASFDPCMSCTAK